MTWRCPGTSYLRVVPVMWSSDLRCSAGPGACAARPVPPAWPRRCSVPPKFLTVGPTGPILPAGPPDAHGNCVCPSGAAPGVSGGEHRAIIRRALLDLEERDDVREEAAQHAPDERNQVADTPEQVYSAVRAVRRGQGFRGHRAESGPRQDKECGLVIAGEGGSNVATEDLHR